MAKGHGVDAREFWLRHNVYENQAAKTEAEKYFKCEIVEKEKKTRTKRMLKKKKKTRTKRMLKKKKKTRTKRMLKR